MLARCIAALALCLTLTSITTTAHASSRCGDFDGLGRAIGAVFGLGTATLTTFFAPAIGKAINPAVRYWPAVGYTALGAFGGGLVGFATTFAWECDPDPHSFYLPSVGALVFGLLSAIIWPKQAAAPPKTGTWRWLPSAQLVFTPLSGGGTAGLVGRF